MAREEIAKIELEDPSDFHMAKKALFKLGLQNGYLHMETIKDVLPEQYATLDEMEVFFFSLEVLEVRIIPL